MPLSIYSISTFWKFQLAWRAQVLLLFCLAITITACGGGGGGGGAGEGGGSTTRFVDKKGPVPGANGILNVSNLTSTSLLLSWTIAKDDHAASAGLEYQVYRSDLNNITTVANAETNGTAVGSAAKNIISKSIGGLASGGTYYFNVVVKDPSGNKTVYKTKAVTTIANAPLTPNIDISSKVFNAPFSVNVAQNAVPDIDFLEFRYTTSGTAPVDCEDGFPTSGLININQTNNVILKVVACDATGLASAAVTGTYTYDITDPLTPTLNPNSRVFNGSFTVNASQQAPSDPNFLHFRYKFSSAPSDCSDGIPTGGAINIGGTSDQDLYVIACDAAGNFSAVPSVGSYTYDGTPPLLPNVDIGNLSFKDPFDVTVTQNITADANFLHFRYNLNGTNPTCSVGSTTSGTINIAGTTNIDLRVIACDLAGNSSSVVSRTYTYDATPPATPGVNTANTSFNANFDVQLTHNMAESDFHELRYTLTGAAPANCADGIAIQPNVNITIATGSTRVLNAIACDALGNASGTVSRTYTFDNISPLTPGVNTADTKFNATFTVRLTHAMAEGDFDDLRYTLTGVAPTDCNDGISIQPNADISILVGSNRVLSAIACDHLGNASAPVSRTYTYDATAPAVPGVDTANQSFNANFDIQLTHAMGEGDFQELRYTLSGVAPSGCADGIAIQPSQNIQITTGANRILNAIACDDIGNASAAVTRTYTYDATAPAVPGVDTADLDFNTTFNIQLTHAMAEGDFNELRYTLSGVAPSSCSDGVGIQPAVNISITAGSTRILNAIACDSLGNFSTAVTRTYTYDNVAPAVPDVDSADQSFNTTFDVQLTHAMAEPDFNELRYTLTGTGPTNCGDGTGIQPGTNISIIAGGHRTLKAIACDNLGNASAEVTRTFTYDITPPVTPGVDTADLNFNATFDVQLTHAMAEGDFNELRYTLTGVGPTDCADGTGIQPGVNISISSGSTKELIAIACDNLGNASSPVTRTYTYDAVAPAVPGVSIGDVAFNLSFDIQLTHAMAEPDFSELRYTLTGSAPANCSDGIGIQPGIDITISAGSTRVLNAISCDILGNASAVVTRTYTYDITPPVTSMQINGGAVGTDDVNVSLAFSTDDADEMYITNDSGCTSGGSYEPFYFSKAWILNQTNSTATVYAKFKDALGNESSCISSSIIHDDIDPSPPGLLEDGDDFESLSASPILTWTAGADGGSGIAHYEVAIGTSAGATDVKTWTNVGSGLSGQVTGMTLVEHQLYYATIRTVDHAGLVSAVVNSDGWEALQPPCPLGFIPIPGNPSLGTSDFCVMKYEAKDVAGLPTSQAAGLPWTDIVRGADSGTANSAWKACVDQGYNLISNAQWQTIARNIENVASNWTQNLVGGDPSDSLNQGNLIEGLLAASSNDNEGCIGIESSDPDPDDDCSGLWHANKRTHALSNGEIIWDFSGNASEWVRDDNLVSQGPDNWVSLITSPTYDLDKWGPSTDYSSTKNTGEHGGFGNSYYNFAEGAIIRGYNGVFHADLSASSSTTIIFTGFRCVFE